MNRLRIILGVMGLVGAVVSVVLSISVFRPPVPIAMQVIEANLANDPLSERQKEVVVSGLRSVEESMRIRNRTTGRAYETAFWSLLAVSTCVIALDLYERRKKKN